MSKKNEVQVANPAALPEFFGSVEMTGAGVSQASKDNLIPMAAVLQKLSKAIDKRSPLYVEGAEEGMVYLKNSPTPLYNGEKGFLFQPVYFEIKIVEWIPIESGGGGGSGFVFAHDTMPENAKEVPDPKNPERKIWINLDNKNIYVETRYHIGFIIDEDGTNPPMPAVLPFSSSGHSASKAWMFLMNQKMVSGKKADSFAVYYRVTTQMRTKGQNSWFIMSIKDAGPLVNGMPSTMFVPTLEDYKRGRALFDSLASGAQKFETSAPEEELTTSDTM